MTCGKEQNPERFHSHPLHMLKFKPKMEDKEKNKTQDKMIVTKPMALRFRSKGPEPETKKLRSKNKTKKVPGTLRQARSVDSSPVLSKKREVKTVPVKTFIQNQKASIKKGPKDLNIEIFARDSLPQKSDSNRSLLPQKKRDGSRKDKKENSDKRQSLKAAPSHPLREIHKIEEESEDVRNSASSNKQSQVARTTLVCYICGREFGTRSISIHQPQCLEVRQRVLITTYFLAQLDPKLKQELIFTIICKHFHKCMQLDKTKLS